MVRRVQYVYSDDGGKRRRPRFEDDDWVAEAEEYLYNSRNGRGQLCDQAAYDGLEHLFPDHVDLVIEPVSTNFMEYDAVSNDMWDAYTNPRPDDDEREMLRTWENVGGIIAAMSLYQTDIEGLKRMAHASRKYERFASRSMPVQEARIE